MHDCTYNPVMDYQWDVNKSEANLKKHRVDFADAVTVFSDDFALTITDDYPDEVVYPKSWTHLSSVICAPQRQT